MSEVEKKADEMIEIMQDAELTYDQMLIVIKNVRERLIIQKNQPDQ